MNICKKCQKEFVPQKGLKQFCSLSCRSSRIISDEQKEAQREKMKKNMEVIRNDPEKYKEYRQRAMPVNYDGFKRVTMDKFDSCGFDSKRYLVIKQQEGKCGKCKNHEWFGHSLTLEIDHIDGNNANNTRENLVALCPNCHSITPTWRGRNKRSRVKVTDEQAIDALNTEPSIRQALIKCGLTPKGGNYKRFSDLNIKLMGDKL